MPWSGEERRADTLAVYKKLDDHIRLDDVRLGDIAEKIHKLDSSIASLTVLMSETMKAQMVMTSRIQDMINKHDDSIFGKEGLSIQVDRLIGAEESRKWTFRVMWGAIIALLTRTFYDLIRR